MYAIVLLISKILIYSVNICNHTRLGTSTNFLYLRGRVNTLYRLTRAKLFPSELIQILFLKPGPNVFCKNSLYPIRNKFKTYNNACTYLYFLVLLFSYFGINVYFITPNTYYKFVFFFSIRNNSFYIVYIIFNNCLVLRTQM